MASPNEKLAESFGALKALQAGGRRVFKSNDFSRVHRERPLENGFLLDVMKGWLRRRGRIQRSAAMLLRNACGGAVRIPHLYNGQDRTFFFFSYEGLRLWTPQGLQTLSVPDQTLRQQAPAALQPILNAFPLPNKGEDGLNDGLGIYQVGLSYPSSIDSISVRGCLMQETCGSLFKLHALR
jgi:hypothetical protein